MSVRSNVFAFTVNTRKAVNMQFLKKLVTYLDKCKGGYVCREKPGGDKEHIHGLIVYPDIRHKDSISKQFMRMMSCIPSEDYDFKKACCIKAVYNDDWRTNYLTKADDTIIDYDKIGDIEYCVQIQAVDKRPNEPLSSKLLSVCLTDGLTGYKEIRVAIFRYLRENNIPPPRMDQVTSMTKSLYCYMNCDNEDKINRLPVPEGFEHVLTDERLKALNI